MLAILSGLFIISNAYAAPAVDCTDIATCDQETFTSVARMRLSFLDESDNMNYNPREGSNKWESSTACVADAACGSTADSKQWFQAPPAQEAARPTEPSGNRQKSYFDYSMTITTTLLIPRI